MTEEQKQNIPLQYLMRVQYGLAYKYLITGVYIKIIVFIVNFFVMYTPNIERNLFLLWFIFFISILAVLSDFWLKKTFGDAYKLAEETRKKDLLEKSLIIRLTKSEERYLRASFSDSICKKANQYFLEESKNIQDSKLEIYNSDNLSIFISNLQKNIFHTYFIMDKFAKKVMQPIIIFMIIFIVAVIVMSFILINFQSERYTYNMNSLVSKQVSLSINLVFALNIISYYLSYEGTSKKLKVLDSKLESIGKNITNDKDGILKIMIIYDDYNSILTASYPTPDKFYEKYEKELEILWLKSQDRI